MTAVSNRSKQCTKAAKRPQDVGKKRKTKQKPQSKKEQTVTFTELNIEFVLSSEEIAEKRGQEFLCFELNATRVRPRSCAALTSRRPFSCRVVGAEIGNKWKEHYEALLYTIRGCL